MTPAARLIRVQTYERTGNAGLTCRRCGVSRPTLRKWWRRDQAESGAGLVDRSRRPLNSPGRRVLAPLERLIIKQTKGRRLGIKRLGIELRRLHGVRLAIDTIHKVLCRHGLNRLQRPRLITKRWKRYERPMPGERVQMDVCKIRSGLYQYTAIDDCSRHVMVGLFSSKSAASTLAFLDQVVEEMPVSIQRIRTDRGQKLFAHKVQDRLREWSIRFRPIRPRSPHLNGKVERVQRTALAAFWPTVDLDDPELETKLAECQHLYTWERPHDGPDGPDGPGGLGGGAPIDRLCDRIHQAPLEEQIAGTYDAQSELILPRNFRRAPNRGAE